jgi:hypothetical protein
MDYAACNIVYVDRAANANRIVRRPDVDALAEARAPREAAHLRIVKDNLRAVLETSDEGQSDRGRREHR